MPDPYSPDPEEGYTKPPKNPGLDAEGGTRVVGPRDYAGGIHVRPGIPYRPIDFDPRRPGVQPSPIPMRAAVQPGAIPVRLNYNPLDPMSRGTRPTRVQAPGHQGSMDQQALPWYVLKQEITQKGLDDPQRFHRACSIAYMHARNRSFCPHDIQRTCMSQAQFGSRGAEAFLLYCQRLAQKYGR